MARTVWPRREGKLPNRVERARLKVDTTHGKCYYFFVTETNLVYAIELGAVTETPRGGNVSRGFSFAIAGVIVIPT
jgi:hypothetical protein